MASHNEWPLRQGRRWKGEQKNPRISLASKSGECSLQLSRLIGEALHAVVLVGMLVTVVGRKIPILN